MNGRYIVGKSLSQLGNFILASKFMPLTRVIPRGINYPYDIKRFCKSKQIKTIFDVGANIGQTSLFFNRHFPQADIFGFEPVKETYEILQNKTKSLEKIKVFNHALGSREAQKIIRLRDYSEMNTLIDESNQSFSKGDTLENVSIQTIDKFCKMHEIDKIDILKIDVQGYELEVIRGAENYIKNNLVSFIYAEVGFEQSNLECQYFDNLNILLQKNNFCLSGFYEFFRWGEDKRYLGFCNALFVNRSL